LCYSDAFIGSNHLFRLLWFFFIRSHGSTYITYFNKTMFLGNIWKIEKKNHLNLYSRRCTQLHFIKYNFEIHIQPVPELSPHGKQACADSKRDSKMIKINFPVAHITELHIKLSISPIPEPRPQILLKNRTGCWTSKNYYWYRNKIRNLGNAKLQSSYPLMVLNFDWSSFLDYGLR
jgi:hypothetical protein